MSCDRCEKFFGSWQSGNAVFPEESWDIVEAQEIEVGTHGGLTALDGTASCKHCGQRASFSCSYGPGYRFAPQ